MEYESDRYTNHDVWSVRVTATLTMMYGVCVWSMRMTATVTMTYGM